MWFSVDLKSIYKSIWIGYVLITWTTDGVTQWPREIAVSWRPN